MTALQELQVRDSRSTVSYNYTISNQLQLARAEWPNAHHGSLRFKCQVVLVVHMKPALQHMFARGPYAPCLTEPLIPDSGCTKQ